MGKFMRKKRTADVAVMEGCLGVRTRAKTFSVEKQQSCIVPCKALFDQQQASTDSSSIQARLKNRKDGDANEPTDATVTAMNEEAENCRMDMEEASAEQPLNPRSLEEGATAQNSLGEQHQEQEATTTSNTSSCVQEEEADGDEDGVVVGTSTNLRLLRESHSDSCLRRERGPIAVAHSRSNSASFTQEQSSSFVAGLGAEKHEVLEPRADIQRVEDNRPEVSTKETEASYGDNTVVLSASAKERQRQTSSYVCQALSITNDDRGEEQPGSSSLRHYNHPTDCGPGWRHRVASSAPTTDEIEEFFAGVEQEKDDRKRFVDKYNFDIFNEAPLPGRFEWVRFNS